MKYRWSLGIGALVLTASTGAAAQTVLGAGQFAESGQVVVSAERLMGFWHASRKADGADEAMDADYLTLLGNPAGALTVYSSPRIGFDAFVVPGLSLGGSLVYAHSSGDGQDDENYFAITPRVGYAAMFTPSVGIWPRGGVSYVLTSSDDLDVNFLALTLGADLALVPVGHTLITVGPTVDVGLSGSVETDLGDADVTATVFGLSAGIGIWF